MHKRRGRPERSPSSGRQQARRRTGRLAHGREPSARTREDPSAGRDREPVCEPHDSTGEPGAGNRHAGFGERGEETCPRESACGPVAKAPDKPPAPYRQRASSRLYYRFANFTKAQPLFRCLARLGRGKVIPFSVLSWRLFRICGVLAHRTFVQVRRRRRATVCGVDPELAARPRFLRLTQARIGDTLQGGNGTRVAVVNAFTTVNPDTEAIVRAVD